MKKFFPILTAFLLAFCASFAQTPQKDTTKAPKPHGGPAYYEEYFPADKVHVLRREGLLTVISGVNHYFLEINNQLLGKDLLAVTRLVRSAAGIRGPGAYSGYGGDEVNENEIRFEKTADNKILIRQISYEEMPGDSTQSMYKSVSNSNFQSIAASFDIKAQAKNKDGYIIDVTDYVNGDNDLLFLDPSIKKDLGMGTYQPDKSFVEDIASYPTNTEIKAVKTYLKAPPKTGDPNPPGTISVELNCSIILLPIVPMRPRYADARVGYFKSSYIDFNSDPESAKRIQTICRWRLEPKPGDMDKYLKGELVEPQKPIVFYIDPATPKKWVPYLIQGVNDWQKAFEQAGFKNAIYAREAPTKAQDSTWSLEDARYSAIVWKSSVVPNASGPNVHDPRTGEILESHINWYYNVMKLAHDWYMLQCGAVDPKARKMEFDDELMGQLIRFISSHEVGHALGLVHNFGASAMVPVDSLRNKAWVEANGHCPSIMDYARFNYVAQPGDNIGESGLMPRIGDYDKWAIEWGYKILTNTHNADDERTALNQLTIQKLKNKRLTFIREDNEDDPRSQSEDLGDNAMLASLYGINNLKLIIRQLPDWTKTPNEGYDNLREMYTELINQYARYMGHVVRNVGGIYETQKTVEQAGPVYRLENKQRQQQAVTFLNQQLFTTPKWLFDENILNKIDFGPVAITRYLQNNVLDNLLSVPMLKKLISAEAEQGSKAYTVTDLFSQLDGTIWSEVFGHRNIDVYKRNLQKEYISDLEKLVDKPFTTPPASDISSFARAELVKLRGQIKNELPSVKDISSRDHLEDLLQNIDKVLKGNNELAAS